MQAHATASRDHRAAFDCLRGVRLIGGQVIGAGATPRRRCDRPARLSGAGCSRVELCLGTVSDVHPVYSAHPRPRSRSGAGSSGGPAGAPLARGRAGRDHTRSIEHVMRAPFERSQLTPAALRFKRMWRHCGRSRRSELRPNRFCNDHRPATQVRATCTSSGSSATRSARNPGAIRPRLAPRPMKSAG